MHMFELVGLLCRVQSNIGPLLDAGLQSVLETMMQLQCPPFLHRGLQFSLQLLCMFPGGRAEFEARNKSVKSKQTFLRCLAFVWHVASMNSNKVKTDNPELERESEEWPLGMKQQKPLF